MHRTDARQFLAPMHQHQVTRWSGNRAVFRETQGGVLVGALCLFIYLFLSREATHRAGSLFAGSSPGVGLLTTIIRVFDIPRGYRCVEWLEEVRWDWTEHVNLIDQPLEFGRSSRPIQSRRFRGPREWREGGTSMPPWAGYGQDLGGGRGSPFQQLNPGADESFVVVLAMALGCDRRLRSTHLAASSLLWRDRRVLERSLFSPR